MRKFLKDVGRVALDVGRLALAILIFLLWAAACGPLSYDSSNVRNPKHDIDVLSGYSEFDDGRFVEPP